MTAYALAQTIKVSSQDVRALCCTRVMNECVLVAGSRDNNVYSFGRAAELRHFSAKAKYSGHTRFVNAIAYLAPTTDFPFGLVVSAGSDTTVHCHVLGDENPQFVLVGHTENVCALATCSASFTVISGSWDRTAIVWRGMQQLHRLAGHTAAVWAVLVAAHDAFVTGSADRTIRIWKGDTCRHVIDAHDDCVRDLRLLDASQSTFVSASNDGSLRIWTLEGVCLQKLRAHASFVYSVAIVAPDAFVSCGEGGECILWKGGAMAQRISVPAVSAWEAAVDQMTGDVSLACSDGTVRVFTTDSARQCSDADQQEFDAEVARFSARKDAAAIEDVLQPPERLAQPGAALNETIVVAQPHGRIAYQWDGEGWRELGAVAGAVSNKQMFEGVAYDHVFAVELDDSDTPYKLPYNDGENAFSAAYNFLAKNQLSLTFLDAVVAFIDKNAGKTVNTAPQFLFCTAVNLAGVSKKLAASFAEFQPHAALIATPGACLDSVPFAAGIAHIEERAFFAVLDLLRYAILNRDDFLRRLVDEDATMHTFFHETLWKRAWTGADRLMAARCVANLHSTPTGRELLHENRANVVRFVTACESDFAATNFAGASFDVLCVLVHNVFTLWGSDSEAQITAVAGRLLAARPEHAILAKIKPRLP